MRIIQITDSHLLPDKTAYLHGVQPFETNAQLIQHIAANQTNADLIILTGDIAHEANEDAYRYADELLKPLGIPYYWIAGNHDERKTMANLAQELSVIKQKYYESEEAQVILLHSNIAGEVAGYLDKQEQAFLRKRLEASPQKPTIIALHHPVLALGSTWMDKIGLQNAEILFEITAKHPQVKAIFYGHIHCETVNQHSSGIACYSTPSAAFQFNPHSEQFEITQEPIGYRIIDLDTQGNLHTEVIRVN